MTQGTEQGRAVLSNRQRRIQRKARPTEPAPAKELPEVIRPQMMETRHLIEPENLRWFVLRVESQKEEALIRVMDLLGIPAAIPTVPKERAARGKVVRWRAPVASGYVLIGFPGSADIPWHEIERFRIVYDVIRTAAGAPVRVPWTCKYDDNGVMKDGGVRVLLADFEAMRIGAAKYLRVRPAFDVNDSVRVQDGPFIGFEGTVQEVADGAAVVLLNILGRQTPAKLPVESVVRVA